MNKKKIKIGSLIAVSTPEAIYLCKVIKRDTNKVPQGQHFKWIAFDDLIEVKDKKL